jgi:carbamoyl-phosphate synthase large subunit
MVPKVHESRPNIADRMINGEVHLAINTPFGKSAFVDDTYIRRIALQMNIPCITTLSAAAACVEGIRSLKQGVTTFTSLQEQHGR